MKKVIIIGAGPAGLALAKELSKKKYSYLILEASNKIGGQLTELYPHKEIVDIPNIPSITAEEYIKKLSKEIDINNIQFNCHVNDIIENNDSVTVFTNEKNFESEYVVIATGLGFYQPRKMGLEFEEQFSNILYSLKDFSFLKNKKVVIFGGGDSALDWAKGISQISNNVSLVHRRNEFRGNTDTIKDCINLNIYKPFVPNKLIINNQKLIGIEIKNVNDNSLIELSCDYLLVNYGAAPSPITFNVPKDNMFVKVDDKLRCGKRIFAIGDVCSYEGKIRRIAPGLKEIEILINEIK